MTVNPIDIAELQSHGLLSHVIGSIPKSAKPAIVIWGKHKPRHDNLPLLALASLASGIKPTIYVDDVASRAFCGRTVKEQEKYNELYISFFSDYDCEVYFSSDLYEERFGNDIVTPLLAIASQVNTSGFVSDLPDKKRAVYKSLPASEIMNILLELLLFEQVSQKHNLLIIRHFTQGVVWSHQKIAKPPLSAYVVPRLADENAINEYLTTAKNIYPKHHLADMQKL